MVVLASVRLLVKVPTVEMWACSKVDLGFGLVFTVLTPFLGLSASGLGGGGWGADVILNMLVILWLH